MKKIIDTHAYFGQDPFELGVKGTVDYFRQLQDYIRKVRNLDPRFLVMAFNHADNERMPEIIGQNPELFAGAYIQVAPRESFVKATNPEKIEQLLADPKMVGLKLVTSVFKTAVDDPILEPYVQACITHQKPFMFHCSATRNDYSADWQFRHVMEKNPDLKVIAAHYGGLRARYIVDMVDLIPYFPNLYVNSAGISGEIRRITTETAPWGVLREDHPMQWDIVVRTYMSNLENRLLFGSDVPVLRRWTTEQYDRFKDLVQEKVFFRNAQKLFSITPWS